MKLYSEKDADGSILTGAAIAVIGYGNQGRPQALNLRDSGASVHVGARPGREGWRRAAEDGFRVMELGEAAQEADILLMLLPDEIQGAVYRDSIAGRLARGATLCFAHGFAVAFGEIAPGNHDLVLVAPKGQGRRLRETYARGSGIPCLIAVERDVSGSARARALAIARGLGCLRVGGFETSFREEAVSDLFGEQAVLCGGVPAIVKRAFDVLVASGVSPEIAYFECCHELKIIVDLFTERGFAGMRDVISGTAAYGSLAYGEGIIGEEAGRAMERLLERIETGAFAKDWLAEQRRGRIEFARLRERERDLSIERIGAVVRSIIDGDAVADRKGKEGS